MRNLRCKQNFNRHLQLLFPEVENYESNVAIQLRIIYIECQKFNLLLLRSHIKKNKSNVEWKSAFELRYAFDL